MEDDVTEGEVMEVDGALTLRKSEVLDGWYLIERAEHDGREWMQRMGDVLQCMSSARLAPDADVEGYGYEMRAIAAAIRSREDASFKRCAVRVVGDRAFFCSPRNSSCDASVPLAVADALADEIERALEKALP